MDTYSLYLALAEESLEDCILPENKTQWIQIRRNDCRDNFNADAMKNSFPRTCCAVHRKYDQREPGLFKEEFRCTEMLCLCSATYCCCDSRSGKNKFSSKGLNKRTLEDTGDGPMSKYRRVLDEAVNLKSTNCGFKTSNHLVGAYEQTKRRLSYFYPKKEVLNDGIHNKPLILKI